MKDFMGCRRALRGLQAAARMARAGSSSRKWKWILGVCLLAVLPYAFTIISGHQRWRGFNASVFGTAQALALDACRRVTVMTAPVRHECVSTWSQSCCPPLAPVRLLATGNRVVSGQSERFGAASCASPYWEYDATPAIAACVAPPAFYRQYTNAYVDDFNLGIVVMGAGDAHDSSLLSARATVNRLLAWASRPRGALPEVRAMLAGSFVRLVVLGCRHSRTVALSRGFIGSFLGNNDDRDDVPFKVLSDWQAHPEAVKGQELGGGSIQSPTTGVEEVHITANSSCFLSGSHRRLDVVVEEFFHTIHIIAVQRADPDAFDAIVCLSVRDVRSGLYNPVRGPLAAEPQARERAVSALFEHDWKETVSAEYFLTAAAIWLGSPDGAMVWDGGRASRALLKQRSTELACMLVRYFPDVGEDDGNWCSTGGAFLSSSAECWRYPGSCYCGASMSDEYLGPRLLAAECPSLLRTKESSGLAAAAPLPGTAGDVRCHSCRVPSCGDIVVVS